MPIGFIPQNDNHDADPVGMAGERWRAEQAMEALVNMMIDACCEALLKQVRRYSEQLECLDPLHHNTEQAMGRVVLALSYDESGQERLDTLLGAVGCLMRAVAEARCGRTESTESRRKALGLALGGYILRLALLWGVCLLFFVLFP